MGCESKFFPLDDDGHQSSLDGATKEVASTELREDEATRATAIQQLREWVLKHPAIKKCRTDSVFLLRFLRTKKFSVPLAQEMLERYLTFRQLYPHWFRGLDVDEPVIREIIQTGLFQPFNEVDLDQKTNIMLCTSFHFQSEMTLVAGLFYDVQMMLELEPRHLGASLQKSPAPGDEMGGRLGKKECKDKENESILKNCTNQQEHFTTLPTSEYQVINIWQWNAEVFGNFDPHKYTSADMVRVHSLVVECLMDEEESQVCGYTHINDESGLTMSHISMWSLSDIAKMTKCVQKSTPMRHKSSNFVNLPIYASKFMEFFITLLNEKLKSRIKLIPNIEQLQKIVNIKILPKEYGGEIPLNEMISK
ncbi:hypothetical protein PR048_030916 [Dryococelus australis]|uniref:CRAL-TRIO domain-containing protein n=1 Tax=Dryococelus australis TaxID=614101 RepID=A0ABQ9GE49_9NEOP|nr:hypothetical protein PR048_030916 [Dryococelus australis]